jgi:hypothetical protein
LVLSAAAVVVLMLIMGFGGHNLYRYTWLWFGGFQLLALAAARAALGDYLYDLYSPTADDDEGLDDIMVPNGSPAFAGVDGGAVQTEGM